MKYQYKILNEKNEVLHDSIDGVSGQKGFDNSVKAAEDGDLINDMKYPGMATYVLVYEWDNTPRNQ